MKPVSGDARFRIDPALRSEDMPRPPPDFEVKMIEGEPPPPYAGAHEVQAPDPSAARNGCLCRFLRRLSRATPVLTATGAGAYGGWHAGSALGHLLAGTLDPASRTTSGPAIEQAAEALVTVGAAAVTFCVAETIADRVCPREQPAREQR